MVCVWASDDNVFCNKLHYSEGILCKQISCYTHTHTPFVQLDQFKSCQIVEFQEAGYHFRELMYVKPIQWWLTHDSGTFGSQRYVLQGRVEHEESVTASA